jgi:hypothetical protein
MGACEIVSTSQTTVTLMIALKIWRTALSWTLTSVTHAEGNDGTGKPVNLLGWLSSSGGCVEVCGAIIFLQITSVVTVCSSRFQKKEEPFRHQC